MQAQFFKQIFLGIKYIRRVAIDIPGSSSPLRRVETLSSAKQLNSFRLNRKKTGVKSAFLWLKCRRFFNEYVPCRKMSPRLSAAFHSTGTKNGVAWL
jgi:hypothetical protein